MIRPSTCGPEMDRRAIIARIAAASPQAAADLRAFAEVFGARASTADLERFADALERQQPCAS